MSGPEVLDVARDAIVTLLLVSAPLMLVGLIVGVAISLFQALTQIQEIDAGFCAENYRDLSHASDCAAVYGRRASRKLYAHHGPHHRRLSGIV